MTCEVALSPVRTRSGRGRHRRGGGLPLCPVLCRIGGARLFPGVHARSAAAGLDECFRPGRQPGNPRGDAGVRQGAHQRHVAWRRACIRYEVGRRPAGIPVTGQIAIMVGLTALIGQQRASLRASLWTGPIILVTSSPGDSVPTRTSVFPIGRGMGLRSAQQAGAGQRLTRHRTHDHDQPGRHRPQHQQQECHQTKPEIGR